MMISLLVLMQAASLPSGAEVGRALATSEMCRDLDGYTLCDPVQPRTAKFQKILCVELGLTKENWPIARCVYNGARIVLSNGRFLNRGDGAVDLKKLPEIDGTGFDWVVNK